MHGAQPAESSDGADVRVCVCLRYGGFCGRFPCPSSFCLGCLRLPCRPECVVLVLALSARCAISIVKSQPACLPVCLSDLPLHQTLKLSINRSPTCCNPLVFSRSKSRSSLVCHRPRDSTPSAGVKANTVPEFNATPSCQAQGAHLPTTTTICPFSS